ncbi:MAG: class I SAM-dependent methyltransferase [Chloroflexi bacterium]|nr:MAG: class I SAM-dependent methyltransferase [Chloroflexota bacterium]MBL1196017.1 class I SAM-dependent methyltransferase [Chloroflexota bacterium]NOH13311.1 class I SAM-dependent methyltransferase [Chloroflexota bacterium]
MAEDKSIGERSYEQFAERYAEYGECKPHKAYLETPATRSLIPDVQGWHILDAGCGPGQHSAWLLEQGAALVTATDVTPDFIRLAKEHLAPYGKRTNVVQADLTQPLDFMEDKQCDMVLCQLVLHYIKDWLPVCGEFFRVLKPGGVLVFSTGHPFGDWLWVSRMYGQHNYFDTVQFDAQWSGFGEPRPTIRSYRRPLEEILNPFLRAGFELEKVVEAQPNEEFANSDPKRYERLKHTPSFLCIRARKP